MKFDRGYPGTKAETAMSDSICFTTEYHTQNNNFLKKMMLYKPIIQCFQVNLTGIYIILPNFIAFYLSMTIKQNLQLKHEVNLVRNG